MRQRLDAQQLVTNPIIKALIHNYPAHFVVLWLQLFFEFRDGKIIPSRLPQDRRYNTTISMLRLMGYGLAEELESIRTSRIGRPAKVYRLTFPD